jgi:hypothetical protein
VENLHCAVETHINSLSSLSEHHLLIISTAQSSLPSYQLTQVAYTPSHVGHSPVSRWTTASMLSSLPPEECGLSCAALPTTRDWRFDVYRQTLTMHAQDHATGCCSCGNHNHSPAVCTCSPAARSDRTLPPYRPLFPLHRYRWVEAVEYET